MEYFLILEVHTDLQIAREDELILSLLLQSETKESAIEEAINLGNHIRINFGNSLVLREGSEDGNYITGIQAICKSMIF